MPLKYCENPDNTETAGSDQGNVHVDEVVAHSSHASHHDIHEAAEEIRGADEMQSVEAVLDDLRVGGVNAEKLLAAFMRLRREYLFPAHFNGSRESLAQLTNITSDLIGRFCWSVETATRDTYGPGPLTRYSANIVIPEDTNYEIVALKGIAVYFVMAPREREPFHQEELKIVSDLVDVLMADSPLPSDALESQFLADWNESTNDDERLRVAIDQVASLTDNSALALHSILC